MSDTREHMEFDVVIIGAGPAGLSTAIRLAQLAKEHQNEMSICILEKGASIGAHILSGAVLQPSALSTLIPDWANLGAPPHTPVTEDHFLYLTEKKSWKLPTPRDMQNQNNFIISLGKLCEWLAKQAEDFGVSIFPGFAASKILYDCDGSVVGVQTGDMGLSSDGSTTSRTELGINLYAKHTILAEGCRGSLSEEVIAKFNLRENCDPQSYGIGIKELWQVKSSLHKPGTVVHTVGWPLDHKTYGGSFLYHLDNTQVAIGFVIGLDYQNPYLDPFCEFQRFKTHPAIKPLLKGGECLGYGARALNEGGMQAIPKLTFPGGMLVGCSAGFLNVPKIKGIHNAMQSGMIAAETIFENIKTIEKQELVIYNQKIQQSSIYKELFIARNVRAYFHYGLWGGLILSGIDQYIFRGKAPWTLHYQPDHTALKPAKLSNKTQYPKPDGKITFDRLSQVYLSATRHREGQPCHLTLKDDHVPIDLNLKIYDAPEQRYCPTGVYEIVQKAGKPTLQINASNCVHCKTCDIKDPTQNIIWKTPEGGDGPNYSGM